MAPTAKPHTGIYMIKNTKNGRFYIGSAMRFSHRWGTHLRDLKNNRHHSKFMQRDWNKCGDECFNFSILTYCYPADLISTEQKYIDKMKPVYNSAPVAGSQLGLKMSDQARKNMSLARRKDFSPMTGKQHTAETKAKISATKTGVKMGPYSDAHKNKISKSLMGRVIPQEMRDRIAATLLAKYKATAIFSDDQINYIRGKVSGGSTMGSVAIEMGVTNSVISNISHGRTYKWVG